MNGSLPLNPIYPFSVAPSLIVIVGEEVALKLDAVVTPITLSCVALIKSVLARPVKAEPSPLKLVAVTTPANVVSPFALIVPPTPAAPNLIPLLAVIKPTTSTFVTSVSYTHLRAHET